MTDLLLPLSEISAYRGYNPDHMHYARQLQMLASLTTHGVLEDLTVSTDGVHALVEDGNLRTTLAQRAGLTELPCSIVVREYTSRRQWQKGHEVGPVLKAYLDTLKR